MIGTAPRRPTHDTKAISRSGIRNGASIANTTIGRATSARKRPRKSPGPATHTSRDGNASRPSRRNIATWLNHAIASCTRRSPDACGSGPLPSTTAAAYTATKPLPERSVGAPNAKQASAIVSTG